MFRIVSGEEAAALIPDGATIGINSFLALCNPEALHAALYTRIRETGAPKNLTLFCAAGFGGWDESLYAEPYVKLGAVRRVIAGHYNSMPVVERMARENEIEAYNMPLGVLSHCVRAAAAGQKWHLSKVGLNIFVDPRLEGPALNARSQEQLVRLVRVDGEDYIAYKTPQVDIAFIRGTTVDPNGNITFENEFVVADALALAQATRNNGGKVIVQVERVSHQFSRPWNVIVPGVLVDAVVVAPPEAVKAVAGYHPTMAGDIHVPPAHMDYWMGQLASVDKRRAAKADQSPFIIGERAVQELRPGDIVNIGIGIPEQVAKAASRAGVLKDIVLTVEAGGTGGLPAPGVAFGATIGADMICDMAAQFDYYDGGGLSICFMGALEVDRHGNVNAHKMPTKFPGIGGFANITNATGCVIFCLTFTAKGLVARHTGAGVVIEREGELKKFRDEICSISFSAKNALQNGQRVLYVTERCVFELTEGGLRLLEVYPGIDAQRDIRAHLGFEV